MTAVTFRVVQIHSKSECLLKFCSLGILLTTPASSAQSFGHVKRRVENLYVMHQMRGYIDDSLKFPGVIRVWGSLLLIYRLDCFFLFIIYLFIFISWRLITLQYCSGFCHTLT